MLPVQYTYYIDLKDEWRFSWKEDEQAIYVVAPEINCNTPSIDVANMRIIKEQRSIFRFDEDEVKKRLMSDLKEISLDMAHKKIDLIREKARRKTMHFVDNWFVNTWFKDSEIKPHVTDLKFRGEMNGVGGGGATKPNKDMIQLSNG